MKSRGLRNNNPGNIDYSPKNKWQGQVGIETDVPSGIKPRFAKFENMIYGIRALCVLLINYYDKSDCDTVFKVIARFAPSTENDTVSYANQICADLSMAKGQTVKMNDVINVHEYLTLRTLVCGIIEHENGLKSYKSAVTDAQIDKALLMAGVEPEKKPLTKSRTMIGTSIATASGVASEVVTEAKDSLEPLVWYSEHLKTIFLVLALIGIGITIWARIDDRKKGLR